MKHDDHGALVGSFLLMLVSLLWGTSFPLIKVVVSQIGTNQYVVLRFGLSTLLILPYFFYKFHGRDSRSTVSLKAGALLGALYFGGIWLQGLGMEYTSASNAGFITSLYIPIVYAIDLLYKKRNYSWNFTFAMVLSIAGMYLIASGPFESQLGDFIVFGGALFWAFHVLAVDKFSKLYPSVDLVFVQYAVTAGSAFLLSPTIEFPMTSNLCYSLFYLAIVCSLLVGVLQILGQRYTIASQAALIYASEPMFASFFSFLILNERMEPRELFGAFLIMASVLLSLRETLR